MENTGTSIRLDTLSMAWGKRKTYFWIFMNSSCWITGGGGRGANCQLINTPNFLAMFGFSLSFSVHSDRFISHPIHSALHIRVLIANAIGWWSIDSVFDVINGTLIGCAEFRFRNAHFDPHPVARFDFALGPVPPVLYALPHLFAHTPGINITSHQSHDFLNSPVDSLQAILDHFSTWRYITSLFGSTAKINGLVSWILCYPLMWIAHNLY